ncbi:MAG: LON peptidase substrate-binding domain-containing protein [Pseudomonadota bacterium]
MAINVLYRGPEELPELVPVFPLSEALLLPRADMPLNLFEPRYLAMLEAAMKSHRLIGMVQPRPDDGPEQDNEGEAADIPELSEIGCVGRVTAMQETGDGRYIITLTGVARFRVIEELPTTTPFRQCRVDYSEFEADFQPEEGDAGVDRERLLETLNAFLSANGLDADWDDINRAPTEALVNLLAMMSPYGAREKQALLEAQTVADRSEMLIAITEMSLMQDDDPSGTTLQ